MLKFKKMILFLLPIVSSYNIIMYPGSQVATYKYTPFICELEKKLNSTISLQKYNPFYKIPNDSIIIGHSFGGTFALLDAIRNPKKVKGVVLLNSHFNTRNKMPYPGIDMNLVTQPTLTILGDQDTYLPIKKSIDDYFYAYSNSFFNKKFIINEGDTHFSCTNITMIPRITDQISEFINNMELYKPPDNKYKWFIRSISYPNTVDVAYSMNILDAILKVANFPLWDFFHFMYFLSVKPTEINYQYSSDMSCLLKTRSINETLIENWLNKELDNKYNVTWEKTVLPSIHPSILVWLLKNPIVYKKNNKVHAEIIVLPINKTMTYYKTPNKLTFLNKLS